MFGRMSVDASLSVKPGCDPLAAVRALVERSEGVKVMKWIEFRDSIFVFFMIPEFPTQDRRYAAIVYHSGHTLPVRPGISLRTPPGEIRWRSFTLAHESASGRRP